jgi:hypothetical protein
LIVKDPPLPPEGSYPSNITLDAPPLTPFVTIAVPFIFGEDKGPVKTPEYEVTEEAEIPTDDIVEPLNVKLVESWNIPPVPIYGTRPLVSEVPYKDDINVDPREERPETVNDVAEIPVAVTVVPLNEKSESSTIFDPLKYGTLPEVRPDGIRLAMVIDVTERFVIVRVEPLNVMSESPLKVPVSLN